MSGPVARLHRPVTPALINLLVVIHGDPARIAIAVGAYSGPQLRARDVYIGGWRVTERDNTEYVPVVLVELTRSLATLDRLWPPAQQDITTVAGLDASQIHRRYRLDEAHGVAHRRLLNHGETTNHLVAFVAPRTDGLVLTYQLLPDRVVHALETAVDELRHVLHSALTEVKEDNDRWRDSVGMPHSEPPAT